MSDPDVFIRGPPLPSMNPSLDATTSLESFHGPETVTEAIVSAVAEAEDASPLALPPLARVVDPDALGEVMRENEDVTVEFIYHGYQVCVSGSGQVTVRD